MNHIAEHVSYDLAIISLCISLLVLGIVLFVICRKKPVQSEETLAVKLCARAYPLMDIDAATDGFNHGRIMAKDHLGILYAGVLEKGELVAVKRIHPLLVLSNIAGLVRFSSVLKCLSLAQHPNIVPIIGFSEAPGNEEYFD